MKVDQQSWQRTVVMGLAALAATAVIIGVVVAVVAVGAARVAGVGQESAGPSAPATLFMPEYTETPEVKEERPSLAPRPRASAVPIDPIEEGSDEVGEITLFASPTQVTSGQRIDLSGVYVDGDGVALQVQRQDGSAWVDFPTRANVSGGAFDTYIYTGRIGANEFRMFDPTTGRSSNAVTVTVN